MFTTLALTAALAIALPRTASAGSANGGGVSIYNNCDFPVYSFTVDQESGASGPNTLDPKKWYWESYKYQDAGGVSIKLGKSNTLSNSNPITQLEYKLLSGTIWYDMSNVDCGPSKGTECPFTQTGMFLHADPGCDSKRCGAGVEDCHDAFNQPTDNWAVASCPFAGNNLVMYLCKSNNKGM